LSTSPGLRSRHQPNLQSAHPLVNVRPRVAPGASDNSEASEEREELVGWLESAGGVPHVGHATLPSPGDEHEFLDWISDFYPHRLDRNRPLWEMALLDGLAHGGWAVVWKNITAWSTGSAR
jgi:hypothetical protein